MVPTAHYFMGGVVVDVDTRTALEGRCVAGEDTRRSHGSNRLGGNGVANSTVFGGIAGAVTATASFHFAKWLPEWMARTGAKLIVGKGGMSPKDYKEHFVPNGAVYLSTVGYGTGALLGREVERVEAVHWPAELGMAQAMRVIRCNRMGPFIVASDLDGTCLFERANARIAGNIEHLYEGTRPAVMKRSGETDDRSDEVI
ncbi:fumarate hydratase C-terminal domain-containing protein [Ruegeria marina]|uniref:L(+)-tartrate dehydratase beta subunit n=1 Tax=Ruegeria marina TaxID=639004 RepID=A0A1G6QR31_9RHOB|nr:fumarate hydratase C-terminal domain-containing protein [Ruegeria marina]SDC94175.1 L(+)-tartrate dehydratase beta subunit [Ruegeria marina]